MALFFCLLSSLVLADTELPIAAAQASSSYNATYSASKAIDNNFSTHWAGGKSKTSWWLGLDLGSANALSKISIYWQLGYCSGNYSIRASNDRVSWVNLYTNLSSLGGTANPVQKDYILTGSYRYILIPISSAQNKVPVISEVKLFAPDTTPPTGTIKINNDSQYTNSTQVILTLSATDSESGMGQGAAMRFSNDNLNWSLPEDYLSTRTWILSPGDATKTVYVKFKDAAANWSGAISDTIILDTTAPQINITSPQNNEVIYP
ncbi:MAG: discoidin domain-containing protein [Candidatus Omnitrophota bacterium]